MADTSRHILGSYDAALKELENDLLLMASHCEHIMRNSVGCLFNRDEELCNLTIADDEEIDQLEKQVDKNGIELLRRFQPVASDLRHVIAVMKLSGNLERIADQAVNIAKKARKLNRAPLLPEVHFLDAMYREVIAMLSDVLRSFTESNIDLAIGLYARDKKLDAMNHEIAETLTTQMVKHPDRITEYLELIFIARHLERAGDHVKNIAEDVVYAIAAEDIRHLGPRRPDSAAALLGEKPAEAPAPSEPAETKLDNGLAS